MFLSISIVSDDPKEDCSCTVLIAVCIIALSCNWEWHFSKLLQFCVLWFDGCKDRYVVDAADRDSVPISRSELHELLTKPSLSGIPLLVLGNKIDKSEALSKQALVDQL